MKKLVFCLALVAALSLTAPVGAEICTVDDVPAATLLLPYFEVETGSWDGLTTIFEINNASAAAALAHVVVWSDLSVPVLDFNVYLSGYDVVPINMRDVLDGILPQTAPLNLDPTDTISPQGGLSDDDPFASCANQLPLPDVLDPVFIDHLQTSLTGEPSALFLGNCFGRQLGDDIARGYVTVDVVESCTLQFPGSPGYFSTGGTGTALNDNILWGNYYFVEPGNSFAQGETLVHIEADGTNPETTTPGQYTFYGRYTDIPFDASDNREPLATNFAARYLTDPDSGFGGTDLIVWRDSHTNMNSFDCTVTRADPGPASNTQLRQWFPLTQEEIVIFDEQEQIEIPQQTPVSPVPPTGPSLLPFPAETQRVEVGGPFLPTTFQNGWMFLNLNTTITGSPSPFEDPAAAQAWVTTVIENSGVYSVGYDAIQLDSACEADHALLDERDGDIDLAF